MIDSFQWAYFCNVLGPQLVVGHFTHHFPNAASTLAYNYLNHAKGAEMHGTCFPWQHATASVVSFYFPTRR